MKAAKSSHITEKVKIERFGKAEKLILKSMKMAGNNNKCLSMAYNNLACYQMGTGHNRPALIYLEKALDIESRMTEDCDSKAETHLNTCAVLSDMSYHDLAM
jgi:hypothetical protein